MKMIRTPHRPGRVLAATCLLASLGAGAGSPALAAAGKNPGGSPAGGEKPATGTSANPASAMLEGCVTSVLQSERSVTFAGEMTAVAGTAKMEISIRLLERLPGEDQYRLVSAPGLGAWRSSAPGVKIYTYIKQVTDLAAPAFYRGEIRFRWLNAQDRPIKVQELRTSRCEQPAATTTGTGTSSPSQTTASTPSA